MDTTRLTILLQRYLQQTQSDTENHELAVLITRSDDDSLEDALASVWADYPTHHELSPEDARQILARILPASVHSLSGWSRRRWWAAAAAILILLGTGSHFLFFNRSQKQIALTQAQRFKNDVPPGTIQAVLTLADGTKITLDSAKSGQLAVQGKTTVTNNNGALTYAGKTTPELLYNTLCTNRGEQSPPLTLSDGTKVWLNAASSIRFPVAFIGRTRNVEIAGEAYFEVKKKTAMPFVVKRVGSDETIQVLGTHFNVNAYKEEDAMKTTLLEGSVKIVRGRKSSILRPGQQAILDNNNGQIQIINDANIGEVMAWKNGVFKFNEATIESIMQQMARWYDVEVVYDTKVFQHFVADIPRDVPVSEVLKLLELTDQVHFKIEGKKITVIP